MQRLLLRSLVGLSFTLSLASQVLSQEQLPAEKLDRQEVDFFEKNIRPVLVEHCYKCHSADAKELKGKLRLDSRAAVLAGGENGPAIIVGDAKNSMLIQALKHDGLEMPPEKKLPAKVVADFERWVSRGAIDPRIAAAVTPAAKKEIDWVEARKFWSLLPITNTKPPTVQNKSWPKTDIDRFVLAKLEEQKLAPVADAERLVLLRRLSFDLIGLPPTIEEADHFLADKSPTAVANLVDRLLDSPHFGERWGRHWLDVARYAESNGNVDNFLFPHAWRYRDYVIAALNADKPLDRFITEQVAGDLLPAKDWREKNDLVTATGFLALTSKPRPQNNPDYAMDLVAEQIEVTTVAFMGLTVACARCHDHKFDPIPQKEFYSLAAIFESTAMLHGDGGNRNGNNRYNVKTGLHTLASDDPKLAEQTAQHDAQLADLRKAQVGVRKEIDELIKEVKKLVLAEPKPAEKPAVKTKKKKNDAIDKKLARQLEKAEERLTADQQKELKKLRDRLVALDKQISDLEKALPSGGFAMGLAETGKPVEGRIRLRGESQKLGDNVPRGFVTVGSIGPAPSVSESQSGRLELAQWITSQDNPLTARVMANRVWRHLFGRGIVPTVDNFGILGEKPTHPELLDHLATKLVADGWSLKKLVRNIVLSRAYQLSSAHDAKSYEADPDNTLVWRHSVRRLEGESLRDALLLVSGKLNRVPPVGSPVSKSGNAEARNGIDRQFAKYEHDHRSVYLPMVRNAEPEVLVTFDLPDSELVVGDRSVTTVPTQSLFLLNSPWLISQAKSLAERAIAQPNLSEAARVNYVYRLTMSRDAQPEELDRVTQYLNAQSTTSAGSPDVAAWTRACHSILASSEFRYVE